MKMFCLILSISLLANCSRSSYLSLKNNDKKQVIALLPFAGYDGKLLDDLTYDLRDFYGKQVIVLDPVDIPQHYHNPGIQQYSGDSLITLLKSFINDTIAEVVGFIHEPIFTIKKSRTGDYY